MLDLKPMTAALEQITLLASCLIPVPFGFASRRILPAIFQLNSRYAFKKEISGFVFAILQSAVLLVYLY